MLALVENNNKKGETLIEVVIAFVLLSVMLVGAYVLAGRSSRAIHASNERTQITNLMREQLEVADAFHKARESHPDIWQKMLSRVQTGSFDSGCLSTPTSDGSLADLGASTNANNTFVFDSNSDYDIKNGLSSQGLKQVSFDSNDNYNIWLEMFEGPEHYDIFVQACWERIGAQAIDSSGLTLRFNKDI